MKELLKKNRIRNVLFVLFAFSCFAIQAETPDANGAKKIAETFFKSQMPQFIGGKTVQTPVLSKPYQSGNYKKAPLFVFQNEEKGFVIVTQQKGQFAVVGYSPNGSFNTQTVPQQLSALIRTYEDSLTISSIPQKVAMGTPIMTPLLEEKGIQLNQFNHENVGNCPTGCVATAFTQIMGFYQYPARGKGSHCYTHSNYGQLCADFENTTYNWNNPTTEDFKLLSYHVGIAIDMNYCADRFGSSPYNWGYEKAISNYFRYFLRNGSKESYFIRNELDNRRPVYAELPGQPGHAVVLDGYDSDGFFHVNFGWGGSYNGYYVLNSNSTFNVGYKFGTNISAAYFLSPTIIKTNAQDSLALVSIYNGLGGTPEWDLSKPVDSWPGVLVMNGRVVELQLNNGKINTYKGVIAPEIGQLTELKVFNLFGQIDGTLPESVYSLSKLKSLMITGGSGSLKVPLNKKIGQLTKLETLYMPSIVEGVIPAEIGQLTELKLLNFSSGKLEGKIPAEIGNLIELTELNLYNNKLTDSIPSSIGYLTKLTTLNLSQNNLSGAIPSTIANLVNLTTLFLNNNSLSGEIPQQIGNCNQLVYANLFSNKLTGAIP